MLDRGLRKRTERESQIELTVVPGGVFNADAVRHERRIAQLIAGDDEARDVAARATQLHRDERTVEHGSDGDGDESAAHASQRTVSFAP